jgi:hypothetical protein
MTPERQNSGARRDTNGSIKTGHGNIYTHTTIEELLEAVSSKWSIPWLYSEDCWEKLGTSTR